MSCDRPYHGSGHRTGLTPPIPFLPNTVKDSPGSGWGRLKTGNRTVTPCGMSLAVFPLLERGNAVRFFILCFFVSGSVSFAFFCRSSLLRVAV